MRPGRFSYWLGINDSIVKSLVHYFGFAVSPILSSSPSELISSLGIVFSTIRYEVTAQYQYTHSFDPTTWSSILIPSLILVLIPLLVVLFRAVRAVVLRQSVPRHFIIMQGGRCCFFIGFSITLVLSYAVATERATISEFILLLPVVVGWLLSVPMILERVKGVQPIPLLRAS